MQVGWGCSVGGGDLALDGGVVADIAGVVTVELFVLPAEPSFDSAQRGLCAGQLFTLLGRPASVHLLEAALAAVLLALAFVRESLARVCGAVALVGAAFAIVGGRVATVACGVARIGLGTMGLVCLFGGAGFVRGMLAVKLGGAFVVLLRLAVDRSGLAVEFR